MDFLGYIQWLLLAWSLAQAIIYITRRNKNLPPGPVPFPIIGNLFALGDKPHKSLAKLAMTHGPIMALKLGTINTIIISSSSAAQEVLQKKDILFANRHVPDSIQAHNHGKHSQVWLPLSQKWRTLRKICNTNIFANKILEKNQILRRLKVQELINHVQECAKIGSDINIGQVVFKTSLNLLSNTFFSVDLAGRDDLDTSKEFKELVDGIMEEAGKPNLVDYFPLLRRVDPQGIRGRLTAHFVKMFEIFDGMIDERLKKRKENSYVMSNDVLDTLLNIMEDSNEDIDRIDINHLLLDLFGAGTDTTSNTVEWAMAELLHNPTILSKAKEELNQIIGKGNPIQESDNTRLPYLQAIVKETFRLHPAAPLLIPRKVQTNVELCGYTIPKHAQVLVNAWAIGRDSNTWENAMEFIPERFLGLDMDVRGGDFELIPFGSGRRICPGLPLAVRMIHLMLGSLVHSFDWKLGDGVLGQDMDMDDKFGLTLQKAQPLKAYPNSSN